MAQKSAGPRPIAQNRKARHDYEILDTFEAGMVLAGSEVKSLRAGKVQLRTAQESLTLIPLTIYFKDGRAKMDLGLARGRRQYDKRAAIAERDADRDAARSLREVNRAAPGMRADRRSVASSRAQSRARPKGSQ